MRSPITCTVALAALLLFPITAGAADRPGDAPLPSHNEHRVARTAIGLSFGPFDNIALIQTIIALKFIVDNSSQQGGGPFRATQTVIRLQLAQFLVLRALRRDGDEIPCAPEDEDPNVHLCDAGVTEAGAQDEYTLEVEPTAPREYTVTGRVETELFDPNPDDNEDSVTFEAVEPATLCGQKFEDLNANGQRDDGEPAVNGVAIQRYDVFDNLSAETETGDVDLNGDGEIDPETERGVYCFGPLEPAAYSIGEDVPAFWRQSAPAEAFHDVSVDAGDEVNGLDFGNFRNGHISGSKWIDTNGDGQRSVSERGGEGWTVLLDGVDGQGNEVSRTAETDDSGAYRFDDVPPGTYTLTEESREGWRASFPESGDHTVDVESGGAVESIDFGNEPLSAELETYKTADSDSVALGTEVTYTIEVENVGNQAADDVRIIDQTIPTRLIPISAMPPCVINRAALEFSDTVYDEVACDVGSVEPGASVTVEITYVVVGSSKFDSVAVNRAFPERRRDLGSTQERIKVIPQAIEAQAANLIAPVGGKRQDSSFDVYVDSVKVFDDLAAGTATPFRSLSLADLFPSVHLTPAGAADLSEAVLEDDDLGLTRYENGVLDVAESVTLVIAGTEDAPTLLVIRNARQVASEPDSAEMAVVNTSPMSIDLKRIDDTHAHDVLGTLIEGVGADSVTQYLTIAPAVHNLEITKSADGSEIDTYRLDLSDRGGQALLFIITGDEVNPPSVAVVDADGERLDAEVVTSNQPDATIPSVFALHESFPNPFTSTATVPFDVSKRTHVRLAVYDLLGRELQRLVDKPVAAGRHEAVLTGEGLSAGLYLLILDADRSRIVSSVVRVR